MNIKNIIIAIVLLFTSSLNAQVVNDTTQKEEVKTVRVTKNDKSVYVGQILKDDGREILIRTESIGDIYITKSSIKSIVPIENLETTASGNYRELSTFKSRYYFTNNALPGKKGDNYAMVHLYGPEIHFSVTDRLSVGVMATWIASPIGLALKYAIPTQNEKLNFSVGTIMLSSGYLDNARSWGGLHWGTATYGKPGKNISLSTGVGYLKLDFSNNPDVRVGSVSSIAGIFPIGEKSSFIFDSMIAVSERRNKQYDYGSFVDTEGNYVEGPNIYRSGTEVSSFFMPGMRFQSTDRRAFQVALAGVVQYSSIGFRYTNTTDKVRSFPVPMCSWFFTL